MLNSLHFCMLCLGGIDFLKINLAFVFEDTLIPGVYHGSCFGSLVLDGILTIGNDSLKHCDIILKVHYRLHWDKLYIYISYSICPQQV